MKYRGLVITFILLYFQGLQYRGYALFSGEGLPVTEPTLEYGWMQEIEIGKICGEIPLDSLINVVLFFDQLLITVDDHASMLKPPRILVIGDEMKYEKTQIKWLGTEIVLHCEKAKVQLEIGETSVKVNNLMIL